jgi:hypothetical protein
MAAQKKTIEKTTRPRLQVEAPSARISVATADSAPIESGAQQLRLRLETALAPAPYEASFAEPAIEKWPRPVRAAILGGAVLLPWSFVVLTIHAIVSYRLFPSVY